MNGGLHVCVCVCVCVRARAYVRACVRACVVQSAADNGKDDLHCIQLTIITATEIHSVRDHEYGHNT